MTKQPKPKCPRCGRPGKPVGPKIFKCSTGCGIFDSALDEGGDYSVNPTARIERQEELSNARRMNDDDRDRSGKGFRFGTNKA